MSFVGAWQSSSCLFSSQRLASIIEHYHQPAVMSALGNLTAVYFHLSAWQASLMTTITSELCRRLAIQLLFTVISTLISHQRSLLFMTSAVVAPGGRVSSALGKQQHSRRL